jgi:hypothetical protein
MTPADPAHWQGSLGIRKPRTIPGSFQPFFANPGIRFFSDQKTVSPHSKNSLENGLFKKKADYFRK